METCGGNQAVGQVLASEAVSTRSGLDFVEIVTREGISIVIFCATLK